MKIGGCLLSLFALALAEQAYWDDNPGFLKRFVSSIVTEGAYCETIPERKTRLSTFIFLSDVVFKSALSVAQFGNNRLFFSKIAFPHPSPLRKPPSLGAKRRYNGHF